MSSAPLMPWKWPKYIPLTSPFSEEIPIPIACWTSSSLCVAFLQPEPRPVRVCCHAVLLKTSPLSPGQFLLRTWPSFLLPQVETETKRLLLSCTSISGSVPQTCLLTSFSSWFVLHLKATGRSLYKYLHSFIKSVLMAHRVPSTQQVRHFLSLEGNEQDLIRSHCCLKLMTYCLNYKRQCS